MITRDALYDFIDSVVSSAGGSSALFEAKTFRNLRGSVDDEARVIRVECFAGEYCLTTEDKRKELNVAATIQCFVTPDSADDPIAEDDAIDASEAMARELFEALAANTSLNGLVCDSYFAEFNTGPVKLGSILRGATYMDGLLNQAS